MLNRYDIAYWVGLGVAAPFWLSVPKARRKVFKAFRERTGRVDGGPATGPTVMIHAVSMGEVNATPALVATLREARPDLQFVISTTSDAGYEAAARHYPADGGVTIIRYPLDFSGAVRRVLDRLTPTVVVLMELEVWPNFVRECERRDIPVLLVNGRMTAASFRGYGRIRFVVGRMFRRLSFVAVQEQTYADRFIALGAPPQNVAVTGSMKFDSATLGGAVPGADNFAYVLGLKVGEGPIWVCGSTGPGEEEIILRQYRQLLPSFARLRLVIVPRQPGRFDEVADLVERMKFAVVRQSQMNVPLDQPGVPPVVLGDATGHLRKFYSVADVIFVGRSLVDLGPKQHGSDMIEAAALGKPVIVGPYTGNFAEAMNRFREADAMFVVRDEHQLGETVSVLLSTPDQAALMGHRAQEVVRRQQGATARNAAMVLEHLQRARGAGVAVGTAEVAASRG